MIWYNETQPTGSEVTEQPSQIGNETVGADTGTDTNLGLESLLGTQDETWELGGDTGNDTDLGLESLLGPQNEAPTVNNQIPTENSSPVALNSSATSTLGQPTDIKLEVSDNENNQLRLTIVNQPQFKLH